MGSNQELGRIQEWVSNWYGTSVENSPFSREDIRNICRGPMREVLVDFLVTRFRTDAQIKVIRSNLFLTDLVHVNGSSDEIGGSGDTVNEDDEQFKLLKRKLQEIQDEKASVVNQILKADVKIRETKAQLQKELLENLAHFEKLESRMQLITHRVVSTTALLDDVCNIKPPVNSGTGLSNSVHEVTRTEFISPQKTQLKTLYSRASDLFNLYFLQGSSFSHSVSNCTSTTEVEALTSAVSCQTVELTQSGLKPNFIEKWARKEQEISAHQISKVALKFSNVMSPVEELANEADGLHSKLMKAHVNVYFKNREIQQLLREADAQRTRQIQTVVLSDASIIPADFLSFIQKEEQHKKLLKCRELAKELKVFDNINTSNRKNEMLSILCGQSSKINGNKTTQTPGNSEDEYRCSFGCTDDSFNLIKQEILEDLTCALLKSFPEGKKKLESTVAQCKSLVLDKFAKMFADENAVNNSGKLNRVQTDRGDRTHDATDFHVKIPQMSIKHDLISTNCPVRSVNEQDQMDLLNEVLLLQNELKENRLRFEEMHKEKERNV